MKRTNTAKWMEQHQRWQINVQKDGIRKSFYSSTPGRTGQRECNTKADEWLDEGIVDPSKRVKVLYSEWIESLKATTGQSHWRQYESYGENWICKRVGHIKIGTLHKGHLQSILDAAYARGLSWKTLKNIRGCAVAFIKYARTNKYTALIIEDLHIPASAPTGERTILQPNDLLKLFTLDNTAKYGKPVKEIYINAYRFEVATGLRPGEVIGLEWRDIQDSTVNINKSVNQYGEQTRGKNRNAVRSFALTTLASAILRQQRLMLFELGFHSDIVFPNKYGERASQSDYYKRWVRYRDAASMSPATPYELRHTFVSIVKQLPEGLLKPLVGHSIDMNTYATYSHELVGDTDTTAELVQQAFSGLLGESVLKSVL